MSEISEAVERARAGRIDYELLGNTVPELHAHIVPRYAHEPEERRRGPAWFYDWENATKYSAAEHGELFQRLRRVLQPGA